MTQFKAASDWSAGANNLASKDRLPKNAVRHAVNVDPLPGGTFASRAGYEPIYAGTNVRGVLALGDKLLIADGADLVEFNTQTDTSRVIRAIDLWSWKRLPLIFTRAATTRAFLARHGIDPARVHPVYDPCDLSIYRPLPAEERAAARRQFGYGPNDVVLVHHDREEADNTFIAAEFGFELSDKFSFAIELEQVVEAG